MLERTPTTALIVVDVLNPYAHEDTDELVESMAGVVTNIADLLRRARDEDTPVIYVIAVPPDAVAHIDAELADAALAMMRRNMRADVQPVGACRF